MDDALCAAKDYLQLLLGVNVTKIEAGEDSKAWDNFLDEWVFALAAQQYRTAAFSRFLALVNEKTIYALTDSFEICLLFTRTSDAALVVYGPYLHTMPTEAFCKEVLASNHIPVFSQPALTHFYHSLPVCDSDLLISAVQLFLSHAYQTAATALVRKLRPFDAHRQAANPFSEVDLNYRKQLARRYELENVLLREVAQGNTVGALKVVKTFFSEVNHIAYSSDPISNQKRLNTILNTLLRKTVERVKVDIFLVDQISGQFAYRIEHTSTVSELVALESTMVSAYCELSGKSVMQQCSPLVRRAVSYIHLNLSSPLRLSGIAAQCQVSQSYLSALFSKEMGESISAYINSKRIEKVVDFLQTTDSDLSDIAAYVGFSDLNYCIKVFKNRMGMPPGEFRRKAGMLCR